MIRRHNVTTSRITQLQDMRKNSQHPRAKGTLSTRSRWRRFKAWGRTRNTLVPKARHLINPSQATKSRNVGQTAIRNNPRAEGTLQSQHKNKTYELHNILLSHRLSHISKRNDNFHRIWAGTIRLHIWHCKKSPLSNLPYRRHARPYSSICITTVYIAIGIFCTTGEDRQLQMDENQHSLPKLSRLGSRICWLQLQSSGQRQNSKLYQSTERTPSTTFLCGRIQDFRGK